MKLETYQRFIRQDIYTLSKEEVKQALLDFLLKEASVEASPRKVVSVLGFGKGEGNRCDPLGDLDEVVITLDRP